MFVARKTCGDTPLDCRLISFTRLRAPVQRDSFKKEMAVASDFFDRPRVHVIRNVTPIGMFQGLLAAARSHLQVEAAASKEFLNITYRQLQLFCTRNSDLLCLTTVSTLQALMMGTPVVPRYLV